MTEQKIYPKKRLVFIASPFSGVGPETFALNRKYLHACMKDSFALGEAPFAPHALYPLFLDDQVKIERDLGMACGFSWLLESDTAAFYYDLGISSGMRDELVFCARQGIRLEFRTLGAKWNG